MQCKQLTRLLPIANISLYQQWVVALHSYEIILCVCLHDVVACVVNPPCSNKAARLLENQSYLIGLMVVLCIERISDLGHELFHFLRVKPCEQIIIEVLVVAYGFNDSLHINMHVHV